jgi:hypothetical protein
MKMKKVLFAVVVAVLMAGCAGNRQMAKSGFAMAETAMAGGMAQDRTSAQAPETGRMIIKRGGLTLAVEDFKKAVETAGLIVKDLNGFVQNENQYDENYYMNIKVPADKLEAAMERLAKIGDEKGRNLSKDDVTMQVVDSEAVLKNKKALRDRLRQILNQAKDVKDVIAVEAELSRVQSEIDSMEAMLKNLKGQVSMSEISLTFNKKTMPGPLGWVFMGMWWVIEKLFVW